MREEKRERRKKNIKLLSVRVLIFDDYVVFDIHIHIIIIIT